MTAVTHEDQRWLSVLLWDIWWLSFLLSHILLLFLPRAFFVQKRKGSDILIDLQSTSHT